MTSLLLASILIGQQDHMNPRRFSGIIKKVDFIPYATLTVAVPDIKNPLVLTARGVALFEDHVLKKAALARINKEFLGKSFVVMVAVTGKNVLQDAISAEKELRFPGTLFVDGLLYADARSLLNDDQRKIAQKSGRGFYRLQAKERAIILLRTEKFLKAGQAKKHR